MSQKIAIDVDGVILDWYSNFIIHTDEILEPVNRWDCQKVKKHWKRVSKDPTFWVGIPEYQKYDPYLKFNCYLTAIEEEWRTLREFDIKCSSWPNLPIHLSDDKANWMIENEFDVLIDDKPNTIRECLSKGIRAIQFYPYYANWEKVEGAEIIYDIRELRFIL